MNIEKIKLKAALIGCGRIGSNTSADLKKRIPHGWLPLSHYDAMIATEGLDVVAICDREEPAVQRLSKLNPELATFTDHLQLLQAIEPSVISIATRTKGRVDLLLDAVAHGVKGIHCEKPIATTLADAQRALSAVDSHNVALSYGTTRRYMPVFQRARAMLSDGIIGDIEQVQVNFGRSPLLWTMPHATDLFLFLLPDDPVVDCRSSCEITHFDKARTLVDCDPLVEDAVFAFASGRKALLTSARGMDVIINGVDGILTIVGDGSRIEVRDRNLEGTPYYERFVSYPSLQSMSGTQLAFSELVRRINGESVEQTIKTSEVLCGLQMLWACAWSSIHQSRRVTFAELPPDLEITGKIGGNLA